MKEIRLPADSITLTDNVAKVERTHTALEVLEDAVMPRLAWRQGDGPKHAGIVFAAIDKAVEEKDSVRLRLPDATYAFLLEQIALDPGTVITPRAANRFYLRIARAFNDAEEYDEMGNGAVKKSTVAAASKG